MHKITTSIHGVEKIIRGPVHQLNNGGFSMDIMITDEDGQRIELTLFASDPAKFSIIHDGAHI